MYLIVAFLFISCNNRSDAPEPYGAIPSKDQIEWQKMEYYMFIHFGPNTFTNVEWGDGKEDPKVFNPTNLNCRQWAATAKAAGMKAIIITAKHHDGFCLWPSNYSTHTVRESAWKDGKGDLLKELSEACKEYGLKFGVYLSPWDQNHPEYGTPEYNQIFANTLKEVLGGYGHVFEQWFDGANGEGPNGKKQEYDWTLFHKTVYDLQPHAIIFSDIGPGCRWMGNERGVAGETNWSTLNITGYTPGRGAPKTEELNNGVMNGEKWVPAETDVSIRPGWFYSPTTDDKVKSIGHLTDIYYTSVGRNSNLLLNVPPDRRGLIHPNDSARLMELRKIIDETFTDNLIKGAVANATNVRNGKKEYHPSFMLIEEDFDSYWATDDSVTKAVVTFDLDGEKTFNRLMLKEYIPLGQRVKQFSAEYWDGKQWQLIERQTTIGYKRILRFPTVTASKIRVNIEDALACPVLNGIGLYKAPEILETPVIYRNRSGVVTIAIGSQDPVVYYTTDGSEPTANSTVYTQPFNLHAGGTVKAKAFINNNAQSSETVIADYDVAQENWKIADVSKALKGQGFAERAIDANPNTVWTTISPDLEEKEISKEKQYIAVDLGEQLTLKGFYYVPVPNSYSVRFRTGDGHGDSYTKPAACNIINYNILTSNDGKNWTTVISNGTFGNIKNNPVRQDVKFDKAVKARYIKLESLMSVCGEIGSNDVTVAEFGVITR